MVGSSREIWCSNRETGRFHETLGDFRENRESWQVCVKNHIPYPWDLSNSFSNSFIDFYSFEGFHQVIYQKE